MSERVLLCLFFVALTLLGGSVSPWVIILVGLGVMGAYSVRALSR